jgi:GTPase Era involved in 16S rRNA processing
VVSVIGP